MVGSSNREPTQEPPVAAVASSIVAAASLISYMTLAETLRTLVVALLCLLVFAAGVYWCQRCVRARETAPEARFPWLSLSGGVVLVFTSLFGGWAVLWPDVDTSEPSGREVSPSQPDTDASSGYRTTDQSFITLWRPALGRQSITDGGVARVVDGVELEAQNCGPAGAKSFQLPELDGGSRLTFDLEVAGEVKGASAYRVHIHGAGVDESFNVANGDPEHVSVETQATGDVVVDIRALRPTDGNCRDSREFLTVQNGTIK